MKQIFAASALAAVASLALAGAASAQLAMPPGQEFYAAPMNKGPMLMMPASKLTQATAAKPMKKKMMHRKMMKKKM